MNRLPGNFGPAYRTIWRWHFLAGLFCLPFVVFLSLTGSVYLFKPQIETWIDWRYDHLPAAVSPSPQREVRAALAAVPGGVFLAYELPRTAHSAARILVDRKGEVLRVYVERNRLAVLKTVPEERRFERLIFRLHGQLLLGNAGSVVMELVASWTIVLIVTGIWLWWPRGRGLSGGVLYPRLARGGRLTVRDLHAVTGGWVSVFLILFLVSGLPWSFVWGHTLHAVQSAAGRLTTVPDWEIGAVPVRDRLLSPAPSRPVPSDEAGPGPKGAEETVLSRLPELDVVAEAAARLGLAAPVLLTPPSRADALWVVRSDAQNRPLRDRLRLTGEGGVVSRARFAQKPALERIVEYGVAAHEGQLFGWANQLLNLLVAGGLAVMSGAATVLWLKHKPAGAIGQALTRGDERLGAAATAVLVVLGVVLPELGASLLLLALAGRFGAFRRKGGGV